MKETPSLTSSPRSAASSTAAPQRKETASFILSIQNIPNHRLPSVRGSGVLPAAVICRPQHSIFTALRGIEHRYRYQYLPRCGVLI